MFTYNLAGILKYFFLYINLIFLAVPFSDKYPDLRLNDDLNHNQQLTDSISKWIDASKDREKDVKQRNKFLVQAFEEMQLLKNDSLMNNYVLRIALSAVRLNDSKTFRNANRLSTELSLKLSDSISLGANYWDLGRFYSKIALKDSAYYMYDQAHRAYEKVHPFRSAIMLLNMAIIQSDVKDYTGSEITTVKAISIFKPLEKFKYLYRCYNNLGIIFNNLEEYDKALFYHNKALEYQEKITDENTFRENTLNNIGVSYELQKEYDLATLYYQLALNTSNLKSSNTKLYAKLLDNLAYSKFKLGDTTSTKALFFESLKIRDSIDDYLGVAVNKLHLAEFYLATKDTISALNYANETKQLALTTKNYRELLPSLLLLSKIDKNNYMLYTDQYIKYNDSLVKEERGIRNKFARIRFETDEFIDANKKLNRQRNQITMGAIIALLIATLLYIIRAQKAKNRELQFEKEQQKSNEEIYKLMISEQNKLDEGSRQEKKRISQELHDGVLGKLFGTRLILGTLNDKSDKEAELQREKYINELQQVEEEIRNISHELHNESNHKNIGYCQMVEKLLEDQSKIMDFEYDFEYSESIDWENLDGSLKMNFFRIIQEGIQNIGKYAKATKVSVAFKEAQGKLVLSIVDDGIGFNLGDAKNGIGLKNMKTRIAAFDGKFEVRSVLDKGTTIEATVPYEYMNNS